MTPAEYVQLKAFARIDGLLLAAVWTGSFACYIAGLTIPLLTIVALMLAVASPIVLATRLRLFRDKALGGVLSFGRGWAFSVLVFFYASILFALIQYGYFAFMDNGYFTQHLLQMFDTPEAETMMSQYGLSETMNESITQLQAMRPIDVALNVLTTNMMLGLIIGLPVAAVMKRDAGKPHNEIQK